MSTLDGTGTNPVSIPSSNSPNQTVVAATQNTQDTQPSGAPSTLFQQVQAGGIPSVLFVLALWAGYRYFKHGRIF